MDSKDLACRGSLQVCFASLFFGLLPTLAKQAYASGISVITLLHYRFGIGALLLWGFLMFFKRKKVELGLKNLMILGLLGAGGFGVPAFLFLTSLKYIPAGVAGIILYSSPAFVIIFSRFVSGERIDLRKVIVLILVLLGLMLVLKIEKFTLDLFGIALAFGSSFIYALYLWGGQRIVQRIDVQWVATCVVSSAALFFLVIRSCSLGIFTEEVSLPREWAMMMMAGLLCTSLPILLQLSALEKIGRVRTSLIAALEPVWVILFDFFFFGVMLAPSQLIGGAIVIGAIGAMIYSGQGSMVEIKNPTY